MVTRVRSGALDGIDGFGVTVEVDAGRGLPCFNIVGLPSAAVRESRERVMAALRNSGLSFPPGRVTVNLAPADVRKQGAAFDLAIAVGVAAALNGGRRAARGRARAVLLGELSLSGDLRPVRGLLAIVLEAAARGERLCVVPAAQAWEARLVGGVEVVGVRSLAEAVAWWRGGDAPQIERAVLSPASGGDSAPDDEAADAAAFLGVVGQPAARRAAIIAAAGRHNLLLVGPPGAGKTRLARALPGLLPPLTRREALEVMRIHSAAGTLRGVGLISAPPFRAPHHTITRAGLIGGGAALHPGEVTLSHRGLLFLDELSEFAAPVLDALREPLEEGVVAVARGAGARLFPASFLLVAAMNPCRCGYHGSRRRRCVCPPQALRQHRVRLSGPLLDRIDLFVEMPEPPPGLLAAAESRGVAEPATRRWRSLRAGIARARRRLEEGGSGQPRPGDPAAQLVAAGLDSRATALLEMARERLGLSLRGALRCARVAGTIAALADRRSVTREDLSEALRYRQEAIPGWSRGPGDDAEEAQA